MLVPSKNATAIVYFFAMGIPIFEVQRFLPDLAHTTLVRWYNQLRQRCGTVMASIEMSGDIETEIGELEDVVEIDESVFGKKENYGRGQPTKKTWVFRIAQRGTKDTIFKVVKAYYIAPL